MSYDLCFWKQAPKAPADPQDTYERLIEGERVEGVSDLPADRILTRIAEIFTGSWERLDDSNWEREDCSFQVWFTPQCFVVYAYSVPGDDLNLLIDIGAEFGCMLYDPQVGERFEG
ncbi:MAG: hypothetical protein JWP89_3100 [Schlesneria sp.]|nr:hypothetical protein [Schlesneria sp.]